YSQAQDFRVKDGAIHLERRDSNEIAPADFAAIGNGLRFLVRAPKSHALLGDVGFIQVLRQAKGAAQEPAGDFRGRLADAARKLGGFLDDKDSKIWLSAPQQQGCGSAGERATNDCDIKFRFTRSIHAHSYRI